MAKYRTSFVHATAPHLADLRLRDWDGVFARDLFAKGKP
jgi:hypothetical protein